MMRRCGALRSLKIFVWAFGLRGRFTRVRRAVSCGPGSSSLPCRPEFLRGVGGGVFGIVLRDHQQQLAIDVEAGNFVAGAGCADVG